MAKIDPFSLTRPQRRSATRTFADPRHPGVEISLRLQALDPPERTLAMEIAEEMARRYVGSANERPEMAFPAIDGRAVTLSRSLCASAATLLAMQTNEGREAYTFEDFVAISATMPDAWFAILRFSQEIDREEPAGNDSGALMASSS